MVKRFQCLWIMMRISRCEAEKNRCYLFTDINECRSSPCVNGGTCKDLINGYECACVTGYGGALCENGDILFMYIKSIVSVI